TAKPVPPGKPKKISTSKIYRVSTPPGTSKGYVGAAHDVKLSKCASSKGATSFSGVVSNPTGAVQSYRIYVAVTGKSTTVGLAEVDVHNLAAKATSRWKGHLGGGVHGATCVLRVERQQSRAHHGR
ncbi:MAG: hypothetical protein J2P58_05335, partial [Acidimicrobiaceae bacterium]|nr:hypothetical protein [Acidimicrobiaceae bacterium]